MMLLRIEQQKIRILKMSRDFTDLPTDKLADLKNKENFDRTSLRSLSQKSKKTKEKSAVKKPLNFFSFTHPKPLQKLIEYKLCFIL